MAALGWIIPLLLLLALSPTAASATDLTRRLIREYTNQSLSCEADLSGTGSLNTLCLLKKSFLFSDEETYLVGNGSLEVHPGVAISCATPGCSVSIFLDGDLKMGENSSIRGSSLWIHAANVNVDEGAALDSSEFAGKPPSGSSGTPSGIDGAGAGHGGRGAFCLRKSSNKTQNDVWGGDVYGWSSLSEPWLFGSRGGTTKESVELGGRGGGRVKVNTSGILLVDGAIQADGGSVGEEGGGGSGGSLWIQASRIKGNGKISAIGGSGRGGASGGRIAINSMRIDGVTVRYHGGDSLACPNNNGAAGTRFDIFSETLHVSNSNKSTITDTLLLEFPNRPWGSIIVENNASVLVPLYWSRVQVRSGITLQSGGILTFGLAPYSSSEFELFAEEVLMSDSLIKVYGALRLSVKMLLMWNSTITIDVDPADGLLATTTVETSNLVILRQGSVIESNANLGIFGQGLLKLSGPGDTLRAERLFLSLFYNVHVAKGALMQAPLEGGSPIKDEILKRYCKSEHRPEEVLRPSEDCSINVTSPFTMQICRVEDVHINGTVLGSAVHVQRVRTISIKGILSASALGCKGGLGPGEFKTAGGGGGHGGTGGRGYFNTGSYANGGAVYGKKNLPCEFGSGGGNHTGNASLGDHTKGGGIIVMGSMEHPIARVEIFGEVSADGETFNASAAGAGGIVKKGLGDPGGGSGGSLLLFLQTMTMGPQSILSSAGGHGGPLGGGGGGGGRIHFHWSNIPTGLDFFPIANMQGDYNTRGGNAGNELALPGEVAKTAKGGEDGTVSGVDCPPGLYGIFCEECPVGTYKNETGSKHQLCKPCPPEKLPRRANYTYMRGGVVQEKCPYQCTSEKFHMPNCYTTLEDLVYTLGGPWLFTLLLLVVMFVLAMVLSVARLKLVGDDDFTGPPPAPTPDDAVIDHSYPFLESLNEVLETTRVEESQSHVHRMYFMGNNTFSEPWHLPHSPPEQIMDLVYEDAFNRFAEEINCMAAYQWWEGSVHSILSVLVPPVAWSWQQWRARKKIEQLRDYVHSEYDHACLRSCRSRALYEGLKVAATPDLMLAYIDVFLGGDEKRPDLPPKLMNRLPMTIIFGGEGSYMTTFNLHSDNLLTSLMGQVVPSTVWYRMVAGLNAQLRTVRRGVLRSSLVPVIHWLNTLVNPTLSTVGIRVDMAWCQATASGYYQLGLIVNPADDHIPPQPVLSFSHNNNNNNNNDIISRSASPSSVSYSMPLDHRSGRFNNNNNNNNTTTSQQSWQFNNGYSEIVGVPIPRRRIGGAILDSSTLRFLEDKRDLLFPLLLFLRNTRPIGHQWMLQKNVGLGIILLLLVDLSLTFLMLLQFYSISLLAMLVILLVLPFACVIPGGAGMLALFSGPRRSAALARIYALWNITSFANLITALVYGYIHYVIQLGPSSSSGLQSFNTEEEGWWLFPTILVLVKCIQARLIDFFIANLEIKDGTLYSEDATTFWESNCLLTPRW